MEKTDQVAQIKRNIATYLALTLLFCLPFYYLCARTKLTAGYGSISYTVMLMWCPALAALLTSRIRGIPLAEMGWRWQPAKYQWLAFVVPILYALPVYVVAWLTGLGGFYNAAFIAKTAAGFGWSLPDGLVIVFFVVLVGSFGMTRSLSTALGEEIGWRGFLTPQLAKIHSYTATSLWMGVIWALFHYPLILFSDYNSGAPKWLALLCFTVAIVASCFIYTWVRIKSGSLWTGAILHASHNLFIQAILTPLTLDTGHTNYYIDEFGVGLPVTTAIVAFIFWSKRNELPDTRIADS